MILNRDVYPDSIKENGKHWDFVTIETYVSKKDHIGKGQKSFLTQTDSDVDPKEAWEIYMSYRDEERWKTFYTEPDDPHFVWSSGHIVSRKSLDKHLHGLLQGANIDYSAFRGISPRRGGAQGAANAAQSDKTIQALGDWSSKAFKLYRELSRGAFLQVCRRMGNKRALR